MVRKNMTIKDIARLAGVSHMTVSRALNNSVNVKYETRKRIMKIVDETNYIPSASARALISGKRNVIGVLIMYDIRQFPADFLPPILEGISSALSRKGYTIALFFDQVNGKKNSAPDNMLNSSQMDGLLVLSVEREAELKQRLSKIDLPVVLVNQRLELDGLSYVAVDEIDGAYQAVSHLIQLGHRHIALMGGTEKFSTSEERQKGYEVALKDAGIPARPEYMAVGDFQKDKAYRMAKQLLCAYPKITAIFCANDAMAMGVYKAAKELGLSIPAKLSVIGYDNQDFCEFVEPTLTTIRKNRHIMGEKAAKIVLKSLEQEQTAKPIILSASLIVRNSTAPPLST